MATNRKLICNLVLVAILGSSGKLPFISVVLNAAGQSSLVRQQETKVVSLSVIAFDSHGQPVRDLQSQDFQVSDQGKAQHITFFHQNEQAQPPTASLMPGNSRKAATPSPAMVLLFDLLNADFSNRGIATDEVIQSLEKLESSNSVYLYLLTNSGTLYPIHPLPDNAADAETATTPWTEQIRPLLNAALNNVYGLRPADEIGMANDSTLGALEMLTSKMAAIPGRKSLIWITHGIPTIVTLVTGERYDYSPRLQKLGTAFDHSDVTVNSVVQGEGIGLVTTAALDQFAELTGGKVYHQDLGKAISEAMLGSRSAYEIKYVAPPADGKYHKIRVTCDRKGIRIQTKQGYYANP